MDKYLCIILLLNFAYFAKGTEVRSCMNITKPINVRVDNCDSPPCLLVRNTNAIVETDFEAPYDMDNIKVLVKATTQGIETDFPMPKDNICTQMKNGYCPVDKGELLTYRMVMRVALFYPLINLDLRVSLRDFEKKEEFVCFQIQCKVVKKN